MKFPDWKQDSLKNGIMLKFRSIKNDWFFCFWL